MHTIFDRFLIFAMMCKRFQKGLNKKASQGGFSGCGAEWIRTTDSRIFSPMLYQLSYST